MPNSTVMSPTNPYLPGSSNKPDQVHQVRMEIVLEGKTGKVQVGDILQDLMQRAAQGKQKTTFQDVHGLDFSIDDFPSQETFATRLGVEQSSLGASKKVVLGFYIQTGKSFLDVKINIGLKWLQDNKVFLRVQQLSFEHGTDLSLIGYYILEHPRFGSAGQIIDKIKDAWAGVSPGNTHDVNRLEKMTKEGTIDDLEDGGRVNIPVTVERSKAKVKAPSGNKTTFSTDVWHVYVPRKFYADAMFLSDLAILGKESLKLLIPTGLAKKNPNAFYSQMKRHAQYMHEHRNISIYNVTAENYNKMETIMVGKDILHTTLYNYLVNNDFVHRAYFYPDKQQVNVSVNMKHYDLLFQRIRNSIQQLSYGPHVRDYNNQKSATTQRSDNYDQVFGVESDEDGSFDPSTIASTKTRNPWMRSPPMELVFDLTDKRQFPQLPHQTKVSVVSQVDTTSATQIDTADIETIVAKAMEEQNKKFADQLAKMEGRQKALEESVQTLMDRIEQDLGKIAEKVAKTLMGKSSIFFTKEDAATMIEKQSQIQDQTQAQFHKILHLLNGNQNNTEMVVVQSPPRKNPRIGETPETPVTWNSHDHDHPMPEAQHEMAYPDATSTEAPRPNSSPIWFQIF